MKNSKTTKYKVLYHHKHKVPLPQSRTFTNYEKAVKFADQWKWAQVWEVVTETTMVYGNPDNEHI